MTNDKARIRLGIIGATPGRGWASLAHIPAIGAVAGLTLTGVATRRKETAEAAAADYGARLAFGNPIELIEHPDIDAVAIVVKTPDHYPLVEKALTSGKHVYCEWPLGKSIGEAESLAALAADRPSIAAIGLQARCSPWLKQIKDIVASGTLGRILSTTLIAYDEFSVGSVDGGNAYMLDRANGGNALTIHGGHNIDALCYVLGEFRTVSSTLATTRPNVLIRGSNETILATSPDQTAVCGTLESGAVASIHIRAGKGQPSVVWEIQGDNATLRATSVGYLNWRPLDLSVWREEIGWTDLASPSADNVDKFARLPGNAQNLARVYEAFADDIHLGTSRSASFTDALRRHRMIDAIERAADMHVAIADYRREDR